ncbi:hypothetical protein [Microbacterium sp.]|uniref:hypothetical protein n=1 Tax=Microbacterium sp. TaxID=51671 RepID=UPI003A841E26
MMTHEAANGEPTPARTNPAVLQRWLILVGAIAMVGTIAAVFVPQSWRPWPEAVAAAAVFAGVVLSGWKSGAERRNRAYAEYREHIARELAKAERDRSAVLFGFNVREVLDAIDGLARRAPGDRDTEIAGVRQSVAVQTKEGVGVTDARAAYFRVENLAAPVRRMGPDKVASSPSRDDRFTTTFDEAGTADREVWDVLDGHRPTVYVEDVAAWARDRPEGAAARAYGTFITARVGAGAIPFGILTVNAVQSGSLLRQDLLFVETLARILGVAELMCLTADEYDAARHVPRGATTAKMDIGIDGGTP